MYTFNEKWLYSIFINYELVKDIDGYPLQIANFMRDQIGPDYDVSYVTLTFGVDGYLYSFRDRQKFDRFANYIEELLKDVSLPGKAVSNGRQNN